MATRLGRETVSLWGEEIRSRGRGLACWRNMKQNRHESKGLCKAAVCGMRNPFDPALASQKQTASICRLSAWRLYSNEFAVETALSVLI